MTQNKIRFGVVGTNFITDKIIAGGREDERFELVAVCSRSEDTAKQFAAKHQIPHTFTSLQAMAESEWIDAVYIASPNAFHAEQSILCMQHGKHVLCEKAFASNAPEVRQMIKTAKEHRVVLMEAMKPTLTPGFRAIQKALPEIGTIRQYFACYCQYSSRYDQLKAGIVLNAFKPELSNGAVMDIGVYTIYPMVVLFGRPQTIQASGVRLYSGVDGNGCVNFTYDGFNATVLYSKIADSQLPTEIQGEDGLITLDRINIISDATLTRRNGSKENIRPKVANDEYYYEVAEFIDLIRSGRRESDINSLENSLITMEIMDEIRRQTGVVFPNE
ncbi:oxidoreductase, NAD-binding domain-containing protein [Candidatus Symbiothrix dinenymphae]|nr:oxidoreductase, NAD-binding domain-containing protein [Candidatus Symbiothrix dinenymphae]